jgi:bla regulator protein BlaR1
MTALGQSAILQALGWAVLNSLWQMALLWVLFQLLTVSFKEIRPKQKSTFAVLLLFGGFAWFVYTFIAILSNPNHQAVLLTGTAGGGLENLNEWIQQCLPAAALAYLLLLFVPVMQFRNNYRYVQKIRNEGLKKIQVEWRIFTGKMACLIGIKKPVQVWLSEWVNSPVTVGFLKPVILVPVAAVNNLTTQQLEALLLHELAHIRRHDYLVNLLVNCIQTVLYFNPFTKLFVKTIEREREKSCDEMVMQFSYDPQGYATALLMLEKATQTTRPFAVAAAGNKQELLPRIERILGIRKKDVITFNKLAGIFTGLLFIIGFNTMLIFHKKENMARPSAQLAHFPGPFYFFERETQPVQENFSASPVILPLAKSNPIPETDAASSGPDEISVGLFKEKSSIISQPDAYVYSYTEPFFANAVATAVPPPALNHYQETDVKKALEASKIVLENVQWKEAEKNMADAFTKDEKNKFKLALNFQIKTQVDWRVLEEKLKTSYNNLDWERIYEELGSAVTEIRLDSLQQHCKVVLTQLESLSALLQENNQSSIPDTDISLKNIEHDKKQVKQMMKTVENLRKRKIIRL